MSYKSKNFTLVEVLIALAVLTMSVAAFMLLIGSASKRTRKAVSRWEHTHLLTQAVEYYMLNEANSSKNIDDRFFPLENYKVECSFESPKGLPEDVEESIEGQSLVAMKIVIKDNNDIVLDSVTVERIVGDLSK
jgi:Prokaryotic N-terminal methylation motif